MSYCRINERDSDVYMYAGAQGLSIHVASREDLSDFFPDKEEKFNALGQYIYDGRGPYPADEAIVFLFQLTSRGVRVPERAVRRLAEEMIRGEWSQE